MKIIYYYRKPNKYSNSIEKLFSVLKEEICKVYDVEEYVCKYNSIKSIIYDGIKIILNYRNREGVIHHITGDVHYLKLFLPRDRTILTIHDCNFIKREKNIIKRYIIKIIWYKVPIYISKYITAISEFTKNEIINNICKNKKITVINNFIDLKKYSFAKKEINTMPIKILVIGTGWNKNFNNIVEGVKNIKCELYIVGTLNERQKAIAKKYCLKFYNYYNITELELISLYNKIDICLFVSVYEGFGMPILEAQAIGRLIITSNLSPMKEISGIDAIHVDPFQPKEIESAIIKIINREIDASKIIEKGLENVKKYSIEEIKEKYLMLYNNIDLKLRKNI